MEAQKKVSKGIRRTQIWVELAVLLVVIIVANILSNLYYTRIDLTSEKRYTLTNTSKEIAKKMKEKVYFKLYLDGPMSSKFKQLRNEIRDLAYEFREASGGKFEIEISNPLRYSEKNNEEVKILQKFESIGIFPVRDVDREEDGETSIKNLLPGGEVICGEKVVSVNFLDKDLSINVEENIKRSIQNIEYELANAIKNVTAEKGKQIVFATGNGEMINESIYSFTQELSKSYNLELLNLNVADPNAAAPFADLIKAKPDSAAEVFLHALQRRLNTKDLLIVCKPQQDYSPTELYLIDQFILKGGKVMWLIDPVNIEMDSFSKYSSIMGLDNNLENINELLLRYGVTVGNNLLTDYYCNRIPVSQKGDFANFMYFPLFTSINQTHPITKNLSPVWAQFPATLKLKNRPGLTFTNLLQSSRLTKVINAPATVELQTSFLQARDSSYVLKMNDGIQVSGVLIEGEFGSGFENQKHFTEIPFINRGKSKQIVIADGDVIRNRVSNSRGILPTGYDYFNKITFGNKRFLFNCIDYLIDDNGLIEIRNKDYVLRLLDANKVRNEKTKWQLINLITPVVLVVLLGFVNFFIRKRKYTSR